MPIPRNISELGTDLHRLCFTYPESPSPRRHGPRGYADHEAYRDWLRDEFWYRCAYCLTRETWLRGKAGFQIDHCLPQSQHPERSLDYENLVYSCPWCNQAKAGVPVPNPSEVPYGTALQVNDDGSIEAKTPLGEILIPGLRLDHPELTAQRRMVIRVVRMAEEKNAVSVILRLLGFPDDLPDLAGKRPPDGNARPNGIHSSCHERRVRQELPLIY